MKTNIFVPSKINVGFQNRQDTYTGKLAYVIYFDEKGKLRKETSWNGWRDKNIPNEIYDNEPTEGFVLNKKVGGNNYSWNPRQTYTRVYDPRGFEFEITIPNLLWILENCNCIKGKGLEGQFVYGWDGKELVLVPVESPDYKEIQEKNKIIHNNEFIKAKDLILGATYETLNGEKYVYMGKYDVYDYMTNYYHDKKRYSYQPEEGWEVPLSDKWIDDSVFGSNKTRVQVINQGKQFWFIKLGNQESDYSYYRENRICYFKNITRKFGSIISTECDDYPEYYEMLMNDNNFSPIDYNKNKILPVEYEDFYRKISQHMLEGKTNNIEFCYIENDRLTSIAIQCNYREGKYYYCYKEKLNSKHYDYWINSYRYDTREVYIDIDSIGELYKKFKPMYGEQYLENGKLYARRGYYGTEE